MSCALHHSYGYGCKACDANYLRQQREAKREAAEKKKLAEAAQGEKDKLSILLERVEKLESRVTSLEQKKGKK